jgi:hypothetical protein
MYFIRVPPTLTDRWGNKCSHEWCNQESPDIKKQWSRVGHIDFAEERAGRLFNHLLQQFSTSPRVLRAYGKVKLSIEASGVLIVALSLSSLAHSLFNVLHAVLGRRS